MKKFVFLTIGFEMPTPEIMAKWNAWFQSIKGNIVEQVGMMNGKEISAEGTKDLPMDLEAVTGMMIIEADDYATAEKLAAGNPYITSIRIYEAMSHG